MSATEINLCIEIVKLCFGEESGKIVDYLLRQICGRPLMLISKSVSLPRRKIRLLLRILMRHNIVTFGIGFKKFMEYSAKCENIYAHLFNFLIIKAIKEKFGVESQMLLQTILVKGNMSMSAVISEVVQELHEKNKEDYTSRKVAEIKDCFVNLVQHKILCRVVTQRDGMKKEVFPAELYLIPEIKLYLLEKVSTGESSTASKSKNEKAKEFPDFKILWRLNYEKFYQYIRNSVILSAVSNAVDKKASEIVRVMFDLSETSTLLESPTTKAVSKDMMWHALKKEINMKAADLDPYLGYLTDFTNNILTKTDDRSGGMYMVNIKNILQVLVEEHAGAVVQERFGSKSKRIFRIILQKKYLEQKKLEELAMISPKDAKEYTYEMIKENFITTQEISKTPDCAPSRTIYLFHVDLNQVCRMLLQRCHQASMNLIQHHQGIVRENKRLILKKTRVDSYVTNIKESGASNDQIEEMEEMISAPEQATLDKVKESLHKLCTSIDMVAKDAFLYKLYLNVVAKS